MIFGFGKSSSPYILHIDDESPQLMLMSGMAEELGYRCEAFTSFADGWEKALSETPSIIFLDVMMPGVDGFEACARFRSEPALKAVPIIMLTCLGRLEDVERAFSVGAADYVVKPIGMARLKATLEKHVPSGGPRH